MVIPLRTGATMRRTGDGPRAVVWLNGTVAAPRPGVWGASVEWLVRRIAPALPELSHFEVCYRIRSWREIESCIADGRAALAAVRAMGLVPSTVVGYSGGGAAALALAADPDVAHTIALAPWLPERLDPEGDLTGRRFVAAHGSLDGLPLIPGTKPPVSRAAIERLRTRGADAHHVMITGGLHQIAIRIGGRALPAPRAGAWRALVEAELRRGQVAGASR